MVIHSQTGCFDASNWKDQRTIPVEMCAEVYMHNLGTRLLLGKVNWFLLHVKP